MWTKCNDLFLNIDTMSHQAIGKSNGSPQNSKKLVASKHSDTVPYESIEYLNIRKIAQLLRPTVEKDDIFFDLGSGKGRILCTMARRPFKKVIGIELNRDLCEVARQNAIRLRGKKAPIHIECKDAVQADLSDGTIYFLFNPFGPDTLQEVCEKVRNSLSINPRAITIVYYNAVHQNILRSCEWLKLYYCFYTFTGRRVSFWKNYPLPLKTTCR